MASLGRRFASICVITLAVLSLNHYVARADSTTSSTQGQIDQTQQQIDSLQNEIAQLQIQLNDTTAQKQTLQNAVNQINLQIKKLQTSVSLTNAQISQTDRQITTLSGGIATTTSQIGVSQQGVAESLRNLQQLDQEPVAVILLGGGTLSTFFDQEVQLSALRGDLENNINNLANLKTDLQTSKSAAQDKRTKLAALQTQLLQQKQGLTAAQQSQSQLLAQTKNQESSYQELIAQKKSQEKAFEQVLSQLQSQLTPVSAGSVPAAKAGTLAWPFSQSVMGTCPAKRGALGNSDCITQYFGNTDFATKNAQIYNNMGHDGVDIGVPIGTPVEAAANGIVIGKGNTDLVYDTRGRECLSFGKWVMIQHPNGLDTLYAHLSNNTIVSKGDQVSQGEVIGYSGMTGYATGPHLHFGVYAASGVQIMDLGKYRGSGGTPCTDGGAIIPVAPTNAYLNPLSYLPTL